MPLAHTVTVKFTFQDGDQAAELARDIVDTEYEFDLDSYDVDSIEVLDTSTEDQTN